MSIEKIRNIGLDKLVTQVYDFDSLTTDELMCKFAQKINIIIEHLKYVDDRCYNSDKAMELKLQYLLGQGLEEQVAKKLLEMVDNGTLGKLINETLLKDINDKVNDFKVEVNEQLKTKVQQFIDGYANVEYYQNLIIDKGLESEDYINAINQCLATHGNCYIPNSIQIGKKIVLSDYDKIKMAHKWTTIKAKKGFSDDAMVGLKTTDTVGYEITNGRFFGQMEQQTNIFKGIDLTNENQNRDTMARVSNVIIEQVGGDGFTYKGRGESFISDITVRWTRGKGFVLDCADTFFNNLSSGINATDAFDMNTSNCSFIQCKAWFSEIGYNVKGKRNNIVGCESQDNITPLQISGESNNIYGIYLESAGVKNESTSSENASSIVLTSTAFNNTIYGKTDDRKQFFADGTQCYVLNLQSGAKYNLVSVECRNVKTDTVKFKSAVGDYNKIHIWGQNSNFAWIEYNNVDETKTTSDVTKLTVDSLTINLKRKNGIKQITFTATNTTEARFTNGVTIGTINEFKPETGITLIGSCFGTEGTLIGTCTVSLNSTSGNIQVWNAPTNTTKVELSGNYI